MKEFRRHIKILGSPQDSGVKNNLSFFIATQILGFLFLYQPQKQLNFIYEGFINIFTPDTLYAKSKPNELEVKDNASLKCGETDNPITTTLYYYLLVKKLAGLPSVHPFVVFSSKIKDSNLINY